MPRGALSPAPQGWAVLWEQTQAEPGVLRGQLWLRRPFCPGWPGPMGVAMQGEDGWCPEPMAVASALARHPGPALPALRFPIPRGPRRWPWPAGPEQGPCHPAACSCPWASALSCPEAPITGTKQVQGGPCQAGTFFLSGPSQLGHGQASAGPTPLLRGASQPRRALLCPPQAWRGVGCPLASSRWRPPPGLLLPVHTGLFQEGPHLSGLWLSPHRPRPGHL